MGVGELEPPASTLDLPLCAVFLDWRLELHACPRRIYLFLDNGIRLHPLKGGIRPPYYMNHTIMTRTSLHNKFDS